MDLRTGDLLGCELLAGTPCCPAWREPQWLNWYAQMHETLTACVPPGLLVFVNVDTTQLCDSAIVAHLERALVSRACVLEWTERHASTEQVDHAVAILRALEAQGIPIAVDDVGDGSDGIGRTLRVLPRYVKLGMALVHRARDDGGMDFLCHVNDLFSSLGCGVIAEGIETADDAARCDAAGIRYGQGFHFDAGRFLR